MSSHAVNAKAVFPPGTLLHEIDGETACCKGLQTNNHTVKKNINRKKNKCLTLHKGERLKTFGIQRQVFNKPYKHNIFAKGCKVLKKRLKSGTM